MSLQPARYKPAREPAPSWRALCWWPACSERVATLLTELDDGQLPPMRNTTRIAVRADFVQDDDGAWRAARLPPRRPFLRAVDDTGFVAVVVPDFRLAWPGLQELRALTAEVGTVCPRCH